MENKSNRDIEKADLLARIRELEQLKQKTAPQDKQPNSFYEESFDDEQEVERAINDNPANQPVQEGYGEQQEQPKLYDIEQVLVAMCSETLNHIILNHHTTMNPLEQARLIVVRDMLLTQSDLTELIPPKEQVQPSSYPEEQPIEDEIPGVDFVEPNVKEIESSSEESLDILSRKLHEISNKETIRQAPTEPEEPEPSGLKKLLGGLGAGKKKPVEKTIPERHQPESIG